MENQNTQNDLVQPINPVGSNSNFKLDPKILQSMMDYQHYKNNDKLPKSGEFQGVNEGLKTLNNLGFVDGIMRSLDTNRQSGIQGTTEDINKRVARYNNNKPAPIITKGAWEIVKDNLNDKFTIILIIAAFVSLALGIYTEGFKYGWIDGLSITIAVVIITTVNTVNEKSKQDAFKDLMEAGEKTVSKVIRDGKTIDIDSYELVVGDIVMVEDGKKMPADMILIQCEEVHIDEQDMHGESKPVEKMLATKNNLKDSPNPFLLQNTIAVQGTGLAVVVAVGNMTQAAKNDKEMDFEDDPTPLQQKLDTLVEQIGIVGTVAAALTFIAMFIRLLLSIFLYKERSLTDENNLADVLNAFIVAITVIVMAIPEGLPLAVAICLAFSVGKLQHQEGVQIKRIEATEVMGGASEICTDKTGTLTTGKMEITQCWVNDEIIMVDKVMEKTSKAQQNELLVACMHNNVATYSKAADGIQISGNLTDKAILKALRNTWKMKAEEEQEKFKAIKEEGKTMFITPFNSTRKRMTTAVRQADGSVILFVKGSPDAVLKKCNFYFDKEQNKKEMTPQKRNAVANEVIGKLAEQCLRCICIAQVTYKKAEWDMKKLETASDKDALEENLQLLMITAIKDPLKPGVKEAVQTLKASGINTRMVTGDNIKTATAIAIEAGILDADWLKKRSNENSDLESSPYRQRIKYTCMEGPDFAAFVGIIDEEIKEGDKDWKPQERGQPKQTRKKVGNMNNFQLVDQHLKVMANSSPDAKYCLVSQLRGNDINAPNAKVVAVTGDGTNDALALRRADVGFAMNSGSEAAKKAGSVVLLTDDFSKTVACVKYGRNIFDCVRKFLQFQLTVNVVAMAIVFMGAAIFGENVLTSVQILWVNLIMDTFAALALATEAPTDDLLKRQPYKRNDKIIDAVMWRNVFGQTLYQVVTILVTLLFGRQILGYQYPSDMGMYMTQPYMDKNPQFQGVIEVGDATPKLHVYTVAFQLFVFMQLFNQINARKLGDKEYNVFAGITQNYWFLGISAITFIMQIAIVYIGGRPLRTVPLTAYENLYAIGLASLVLPWAVVCKMLIPVAWFEQVAIDEKPMTAEKRLNSSMSNSARMSYNKKNPDKFKTGNNTPKK